MQEALGVQKGRLLEQKEVRQVGEGWRKLCRKEQGVQGQFGVLRQHEDVRGCGSATAFSIGIPAAARSVGIAVSGTRPARSWGKLPLSLRVPARPLLQCSI